MKPLPALGFVLGLVFSTAAMAEGPNTVPLHDTPLPLPAISLADEHGNSLTLDRWRGKVVLLNVWATWCAPCRHEMPTLDRLQATLGSERFEVVALSINRAGVAVVRRFFDEIGIRYLGIFIDETIRHRATSASSASRGHCSSERTGGNSAGSSDRPNGTHRRWSPS